MLTAVRGGASSRTAKAHLRREGCSGAGIDIDVKAATFVQFSERFGLRCSMPNSWLGRTVDSHCGRRSNGVIFFVENG